MNALEHDRPKVSICVPIYNVELFISRCVESLLQQTYSNLEFVFINDCTPDKSMEILQETLNHYSQRKHQVKIINLPLHRGTSYARNLAINIATGDFIFHVDSDDWIEIDAVEILMARQQESNADLVFGNHIVHYFNGEIKAAKQNIFSLNNPLEYILKNTHNYHVWGHLILKNLYTSHNIQCKNGTDVGEDLQVLPKLCYYANKFVSVDNAIYHYNKCNPKSIGQKEKNRNWFEQSLESYNIFYVFFEKMGTAKYTDILHKSKYDFLYRSMRTAAMEGYKETFFFLKSELQKHEALYPQYKYCDLRHLLKKDFTIYHYILKHFR